MTRLYLSWLWLRFNVNNDRHRYDFEFSREHEQKAWLLSIVDKQTDKYVKNLFFDKDRDMNGYKVYDEITSYGMEILNEQTIN